MYSRRRRNPDNSTAKWGWGLAALLGLFLVPAVAAIKTHSKRPIKKAAIQELANKWGPVFAVPASTIMSIAQIESGYKPDTVNWSLNSIPLGGAWGPLQMTKSTADDWAKILSGHSNAQVRERAARWKGDGQLLIDDLDFAVMMSAAMLGKLTKQFGDFKLVAGAYHQGAGKIAQMVRDKLRVPQDLPPKGKAYVTAALKTQGKAVA